MYAGLPGRVALITGATGGLGVALARRFLANGSNVALSDQGIDSLEMLRNDAIGANAAVSISIHRTDLSGASSYDELVGEVIEAHGSLNILVNNAALLSRSSLENLTLDEFDQIIAVNLRAPLFLAKAAIPVIRRSGHGSIVNVASMAGRTGGARDAFAYAASKGGLLAVTKSLARAAAQFGIRVNAILPANIDSAMMSDLSAEALAELCEGIPLGRLASASEVAELVLWLASDSASYVTGGQYDIAGGWSM